MPYTVREYAEMHFVYGFCNGNARAAEREYRERFPGRERYPDYRVFQRVHNAYVEGQIPGNPHRAGRPYENDDAEDDLVEMALEEPSTSVRRISRRSGIPRTTVHRILRRNQLHPYHVQRVQDLRPGDYDKRVEFSREMLRRNRQDPQFFNKILWSDESSFRRAGIFNIHNLHHWAYFNPRIVRNDRFQHQFSVNMWSGIFNGSLIGPFELPARLNGEIYRRFLTRNLPVLLEDIPLNLRQSMWLQHDGAPAHYSLQVRQFLNRAYPGRWIGRGGTIRWPPRSPDLNPIDFFLWGYFKELVYARENHNEEELRHQIITATRLIRQNERSFRMIKRNFIRRCRLCIRSRGRHFEHLL